MTFPAPEDAATLLESFLHDIANTPAEITHLLEEIQAKDLQIHAFKDEIHKRDAQLQKWVRLNGGHILNPKEEGFSRTINDCYDKCEILQAEKCGLSEKALVVLERQIRRLDVGLRGLASREEFPADWGGPSLLVGGSGGGTGTGGSTPVPGVLKDVSGNIGSTGGAPNIANAAQMRMAQAAGAGGSGRGGQTTPIAANMARSQREGSTDASSKRRRLNPSLGNLPTASSHLRQSSLGPGTPKAGTPGPSGTGTSRAGSAQPPAQRGAAAAGNKKDSRPQQAGKKLAPHQTAGAANNKKRVRTGGGHKKGDRRRQLTRDRATPSTNASASDSENSSASPTPSSLPRSQADGASDRRRDRHSTTAKNTNTTGDVDEEEDYEEENDDQLYCYCQKVSFGDMVGCDNDDCKYQWFHWSCVGLKSEPEGEWLCPTCREMSKGRVRISKA